MNCSDSLWQGGEKGLRPEVVTHIVNFTDMGTHFLASCHSGMVKFYLKFSMQLCPFHIVLFFFFPNGF